MPVEPCAHLERIVLDTHVQQRIAQRGGDVETVKTRVRRAHTLVSRRPFLFGVPLALLGEDVVPVVKFRQGGSRAVVATVLCPSHVLKPGTVPLKV
jgi:hypothetical protein